MPYDSGEIVSPATDDRRDYDGDGFGDAADPFNDPSQSRVQAAATDYVDFGTPGSGFAIDFVDDVVIEAPNGRALHVVPSVLGHTGSFLRVYLDGRTQGDSTGLTVEGDSLAGSPADGTWVIRRGGSSVPTTAHLQGKTLQVEGCCEGPTANEVPFNWHEAGSFTYFAQAYSGGREESPRYLRLYLPDAR